MTRSAAIVHSPRSILIMNSLKAQNVSGEFFVSPYGTRRPVLWEEHFRRRAPLDLEIGFGMGDFLVRMARDNPRRNVIGVESDWPRVKKTLQRIGRINRAAAVGEHLQNIRVVKIDVRVALERLFALRSIERMFCLFPCPWPKKRHVKHRLFSRDFLRLANSRLVTGGTLLIVTDYLPYGEWIVAENKRTGFRLDMKRVRPRYDTKYERKWREAGQEEFYEILMTKKRHINVPLEEDVPLRRHVLSDFEGRKFRFRDVRDATSVIGKDFVFDEEKGKGMLHLIVAEATITQHVWIEISRTGRGWTVAVSEGQAVLPTRGVAQALRETSRQAGGGGEQGEDHDVTQTV